MIEKQLNPIYGGVQAGHAVAQWLLQNPDQDWNNQYLIYLSADLSKWTVKLDILGIPYTEFREPDKDNMITAIAVHGNDKCFSKLKLLGA